MKAIAVFPGTRGARVIETNKPVPASNQVLVRVFEAGICTTDREIYRGFYGETPKENSYLIMGHESVGLIEYAGSQVQTDLRTGDYVVRTVRRPCRDMCLNCRNNEQDMCLTGKFTETGIKGLHGIMTEYYADTPENLVKIDEKDLDVGVLLEPMAFSYKAVHQIFNIQERMHWNPKTALIFGAGPIGLLEAMILRNYNLKVDVAARTPEKNPGSEIVSGINGRYIQLDELGLLQKYDIIIESSGNSLNIRKGLDHLNNNGVLCLTSITGGNQWQTLKIDEINLDMVLGNKTIAGVVNSNITDYVQAQNLFSIFKNRWPGILEKMVTRRISFSEDLDIRVLFKKERNDIKVVLDIRGEDGREKNS